MDVTTFTSLYTDIVGFILRSTNVRNAFEVHFPLKRLIQATIGDDAKLVMSSEWKFVPFTWPMNLPLLQDFVLVGGPAPESGNVLIIPLAGHEIGHSAWRRNTVDQNIRGDLLKAIDKALEANAALKTRALADLERGGHDASFLQMSCYQSAIKQLEETYCDMFALYVFGPSFAFAYEYFLAPGGLQRSPFYPSSLRRVEFLLSGAKLLGLTVDPLLFHGWKESISRAGQELLAIADAAVLDVLPTIQGLAFDALRAAAVPMCDDAAVQRVKQALARGAPMVMARLWLRSSRQAGCCFVRGAGYRAMRNVTNWSC